MKRFKVEYKDEDQCAFTLVCNKLELIEGDSNIIRISWEYNGEADIIRASEIINIKRIDCKEVSKVTLSYKCFDCSQDHTLKCFEFKMNNTSDGLPNMTWKTGNSEWKNKVVKKINWIHVEKGYHEEKHQHELY